MKLQMLTQREAIEQGYKYCTPFMEETKIINIEECDFKMRYVLLTKDPLPYQIRDTLILELLCDHLDSQDEVYDEDGHLNDAVAKVDFTGITQRVNDALAESIRFYHETDFFLIPNE